MKKFSAMKLETCSTGIVLALFIGSLNASGSSTNVSYGPSAIFTPAVVTITAGDTVNWVGESGHTLLGTGSDPICGGASLPCSYVFPNPGSYPYICTVPSHAQAGMTGLVVVVAAPAPVTPAVLTNAFITNGLFQFTVLTASSQTNIVEATTNPVIGGWTPLTTNVPAGPVFIFTDSNAPASPIRFYRVAKPN